MISRRFVVFGAAALVAPLLTGTGSATSTDPCLSPPPTLAAGRWAIDGMIGYTGTSGDDQIVGTTGPDVLYGMGGDDVIKGLGGDDTICGGDGRDGINGGNGFDRIGGGADNDFIVGHDENDTIWGGTGRDGVYGGNGADTINGTDDAEVDYLVGGPGVDTVNGPADESHQDAGPIVTSCPSDSARWQGVFGTSTRLPARSTPCRTYSGRVVQANNTGDGDRHFKLRLSDGSILTEGGVEVAFELMPRDKPVLGTLQNEAPVTVFGLFVSDMNHGGKPEIHPIYWITVSGTTYYLGPRLAGSPHRMRPPNLIGTTTSNRYCWDELGRPCNAYDTSTGAFSLRDVLLDATQRLADEADRTYS